MSESDYTYEIKVSRPDVSFNYRVTVFCRGMEIAYSYCDTKWGGRRYARKIMRRHAAMPDPRNPEVVERGEVKP